MDSEDGAIAERCRLFQEPKRCGMRNRMRDIGTACRLSGCCFLAAAILACAASLPTPLRADEVVLIAPQVWQGFEDYKRQKQPKIFAVSADGLTYGYSYCPEYRCRLTPDARSLALASCAKSGGRACFVFAVGTDIEVPYKVMTLDPQ
jgi:hypothetical protein